MRDPAATSKSYTALIPALDRTGPVNVAVDLARAASQRGWKVKVLHLSTVRNPRDDLDFASEVRPWRWSDLWQLHGVVHTHCLRPDLVGGLLSWNRRCKLITTLHNFFLIDVGFDHPRAYAFAAWLLWTRAIARYAHVVCISEAMRRYYRRLLPGVRFEVVRNFRQAAAPGDSLAPAVSQWLNEQRRANRTVLAYAGSLSPRKNVVSLLDRIASRDDCALLVCGAGTAATELESRALQLSIHDRLLLCGHVAVPSHHIARADVLVLPSLAEGFPLVVLEAASVGVPSLLSNIAVHREIAALGFGVTFDHLRGIDFSGKLDVLLSESKAPDAELQQLWLQQFSPDAGFARYHSLFESSLPAAIA